MFKLLQQCGQQFGGPFRDQLMANHPANMKMFLFFMIVTIIFVVFIKLLVAWLVYKDAVAKNIENKKVWFFLVFVSSILGVIFYFIMVIYQHKNNITPYSSSTTSTTHQVQHSSLNSSQSNNPSRICKNCGTEGDGKFCAKCGSKFT